MTRHPHLVQRWYNGMTSLKHYLFPRNQLFSQGLQAVAGKALRSPNMGMVQIAKIEHWNCSTSFSSTLSRKNMRRSNIKIPMPSNSTIRFCRGIFTTSRLCRKHLVTRFPLYFSQNHDGNEPCIPCMEHLSDSTRRVKSLPSNFSFLKWAMKRNPGCSGYIRDYATPSMWRL